MQTIFSQRNIRKGSGHGGINDTITGTVFILLFAAALFVVPASATTTPSAAFVANATTGNAPLGVQFIDSSVNSPTSWVWSFGDGGTSTEQNPSHTYSGTGSYTVTLTVTNSGGSDTVSSSGYITVDASVPVTVFTANVTSGNVPLYVQFMDNSTNTPTSWYWYFGDGGTSTLEDPIYEYTEAGTYSVELIATNSAGSNTTTESGYITVTALSVPVTSFTSDLSSGKSPLVVQFTDTSTGSPTTWAWSFGDGSTSVEENPSHTYTSAGSYTVSLTATNAEGSRITTATNYITVSAASVVTSVATTYATVATARTISPVTVETTVANLTAPVQEAGGFGTIPVVGIIAALLICGAAVLFLRRPPRGPHGYRSREL